MGTESVGISVTFSRLNRSSNCSTVFIEDISDELTTFFFCSKAEGANSVSANAVEVNTLNTCFFHSLNTS